jgi:hypothetical protein
MGCKLSNYKKYANFSLYLFFWLNKTILNLQHVLLGGGAGGCKMIGGGSGNCTPQPPQLFPQLLQFIWASAVGSSRM